MLCLTSFVHGSVSCNHTRGFTVSMLMPLVMGLAKGLPDLRALTVCGRLGWQNAAVVQEDDTVFNHMGFLDLRDTVLTAEACLQLVTHMPAGLSCRSMLRNCFRQSAGSFKSNCGLLQGQQDLAGQEGLEAAPLGCVSGLCMRRTMNTQPVCGPRLTLLLTQPLDVMFLTLRILFGNSS